MTDVQHEALSESLEQKGLQDDLLNENKGFSLTHQHINMNEWSPASDSFSLSGTKSLHAAALNGGTESTYSNPSNDYTKCWKRSLFSITYHATVFEPHNYFQ